MATMNMETRNGGSPEPQPHEVNGEAPSGFILKLFQMVNGAPDEVITVSFKSPGLPSMRTAAGVQTRKTTQHTRIRYTFLSA